jgi:hypothetical protein
VGAKTKEVGIYNILSIVHTCGVGRLILNSELSQFICIEIFTLHSNSSNFGDLCVSFIEIAFYLNYSNPYVNIHLSIRCTKLQEFFV